MKPLGFVNSHPMLGRNRATELRNESEHLLIKSLTRWCIDIQQINVQVAITKVCIDMDFAPLGVGQLIQLCQEFWNRGNG